MVTFVVLTLALILLLISAIFVVSIGGAAFFIVYGDFIVCGLIIGLIVRHLIKKRKK